MKNITSINTERFALNNTNPYDAFIWLGKNFIEVAVSDTEHSKIEAVSTYRKEKGNITRSEALEVFSQKIISKAKRCYVGLESKKFTLIPANLYDSKKIDSYLSAIYSIEKEEAVSAQKVKPVEAVSIFSLKTNTEGLIKRELNNSTIFHAPTALLIAYQQLVPPNKKNMSFVRLQQDEMLITIFQNKKLQLHSSFDIENMEDAFYYYYNAIDQLGMDRKTVTLNLLGNHPEIEKFNQIATANLEGSKLVNRLPTLQYDDQVFSHPTHHFFNLFALVLCAS